MARRRKNDEPKKPFAGAMSSIDRMERQVCYRTVTAPCGPKEFVDWLYPADVLALLRAAYPYTEESHPDVHKAVNLNGVDFSIRIDCDKVAMCTPKDALMEAQEDKHGIVPVLFEIKRVHDDFNLVRKVVRWMNDNATPGAARYYFPAIGNFLAPEHPYFKSEGTRYMGTKKPISEIAHDIRRASEIIVMGLLAGTVDREAPAVRISVGKPYAIDNSQPFHFC